MTKHRAHKLLKMRIAVRITCLSTERHLGRGFAVGHNEHVGQLMLKDELHASELVRAAQPVGGQRPLENNRSNIVLSVMT